MTARDFSPDPGVVAAVERELLARNGRERGDKITSTCIEPLRHRNGDQHPSLQYNRKKHAWNCRVCGAKGGFLALAKALGIDLPKRASVKSNAKREGITLAQYAELKQLDLGFLTGEGLTDATYAGAPAVWIPFPAEDGTHDGAGQYRVERSGPDHLMSAAGHRQRPYGLHRLALARATGYIALVEGPSCTQTLWSMGEPALGLPGASVSDPVLAQLSELLTDIPVLDIVREPDGGGATLLARLAASPLRDRVRVVSLAPFKDVSALYLDDREAFGERWRAALGEAVTLDEAIRREAGDGRALLEDLRTFVSRFVVLSAAELVTLVLWAIHTHALDAADVTPYLHITSAEKRSGKTRLLEVLGLLVARPWLTGRVTAAVLVRKVDAEQPTLLLDESDAAFKSGEEYAEALRGLLNTGHRRGGTSSLCVGQGANITYKDFSTFGAKGIAGIGRLPDTVADRSIRIELKRRAPGEVVQRFRLRKVKPEAADLFGRIKRWASANLDALKGTEPELPDELNDRAQDAWEALFAIADLVGGDWPRTARRASTIVSGGDAEADDSLGVRLLEDIRRTFNERGTDRITTADLVADLVSDAELPWVELHKGKPITAAGLARLLKPFGISSRTIWLGDDPDYEPDASRTKEKTKKGYHRERFEDAWARYLPSETSGRQDPSGRVKGQRSRAVRR